jgi:hypothetical protein
MVHLLAAEQTPLTVLHIAGRDHSDHASWKASKHHKGQPAVEGFAQGDIASDEFA